MVARETDKIHFFVLAILEFLLSIAKFLVTMFAVQLVKY